MKRAAVVGLLLFAPVASGQEADRPVAIRVDVPSTLHIPGKGELDLPPVLILPKEAEDAVQGEIVRLQTAETRLKAENEALRQKPFSIKVLLIAAGVGFAAGTALAIAVK